MRNSSKFKAFFLGVLAVLILGELALRSLGWIMGSSRSVPAPQKADGNYTVLCLGNSHTWGDGAPPEKSFPNQLQGLFDQANLRPVVKVVNGGRINVNSSYILENLEANLDLNQPDLVVLMAGEPNSWNKYRFGAYLREQDATRSTFLYGIHDLLDHLRIFRFASLAAGGWRSGVSETGPVFGTSLVFKDQPLSDPLALGLRWLSAIDSHDFFVAYRLSEAQFEEGKKAFEGLIRLKPDFRPAYIGLALLHHRRGEYRSALNTYERSLRAQPERFDFEAYYQISDLLKLNDLLPEFRARSLSLLEVARRNFPGEERYSQLVAWIADKRPRSFDPKDPAQVRREIEFYEKALSVKEDHLYSVEQLVRLLLLQGQDEKAADTLIQGILASPYSTLRNFNAQLAQVKRKSPAASARIDAFLREHGRRFQDLTADERASKDEVLEAWIERDLRRMMRILDDRGIPLVLQTYPPTRTGVVRIADKVILKLAREKGIPLANNLAALEKAFAESGNKDSFYSNRAGPYDNHLNSRGYEIVARVLHDTILGSQRVFRDASSSRRASVIVR